MAGSKNRSICRTDMETRAGCVAQQKREKEEEMCVSYHSNSFLFGLCALSMCWFILSQACENKTKKLARPLSNRNRTKAEATDTPKSTFLAKSEIRHSSPFLLSGAASLHVPPQPSDFSSVTLTLFKGMFLDRKRLKVKFTGMDNDSRVLCFETRESRQKRGQGVDGGEGGLILRLLHGKIIWLTL